MSSKKKAAKRSTVVSRGVRRTPPTKKKVVSSIKVQPAEGLFLIVPRYDKISDVFSSAEDVAIIGPLSEKEAINTIDDKVKDGCERTSITVISGKKLSVLTRIQ